MSTAANELHMNDTPRQSLLSPTSPSTLSPTWRPPKSPLAPHRLAMLANALGVSTPVPATLPGTSFLSRSFSESASSMDRMPRSPTPSSVGGSSIGYSSHSPAPSTSKFLLHVVPPLHLPHDSNSNEDLQGPPPPNAPGYHTQFRRGTLVPVHSTLNAQLGAIAREYALPSSAGLILYLVTSPQSPSPNSIDEPGPRLSEDIWKHLWTRVVRAEQRDDGLMPSRSPTPHTPHAPLILRLAPAARSTPFLAQEQTTHLPPLINAPNEPLPPPLPSPNVPQPTYPTPTAPSTPSTSSGRQSNNKSAPPSISQSEPGTPDTSVDDSGLRANFLDLPGLNSPSLIPILAKVEFDIDRRKAAWYEPWVRSRKVNHAKRAQSRTGSRNQETDGNDEVRVHAPIELLTGKAKKDDPFGLLADAKEAQSEAEAEKQDEEQEEDAGYARLSESPDEINSDSDSDTEDFNEDATARISASLVGKPDPLADVFGTDEDTWAEIRAENGELHRPDNPNIVNLALTAAELSSLPNDLSEELDDETRSTKEEDDVLEMLDMMGKHKLAISIPSPEKDVIKRTSSPSVNGARKIPPPLILKTKDQIMSPSVAAMNIHDTSADTPRLAYRSEMSDHSASEHEDDMDDLDKFTTRVRSPAESDKRGGAVFDDLDLGLDPTEDFDDNDPNDRRRSQYLMSAQLDAIERTMASLSPRFMTTSLEEEQNLSFNSATLSPSTPANLSLSPGKSFEFLAPPSPRLPQHPNPPEDEPPTGQSWPAIPFSAIKDRDTSTTGNGSDRPPSPPRFALNGVSTSAPKSYMPSIVTEQGPSESERRKQELAEEEAFYKTPNFMKNHSSAESPIIPLSPDPFGRHPSSPEPPMFQVSGNQWDTMTIGKGGADVVTVQAPAQGRARSSTTSRFSVDSLKGDSDPAAAGSKPNNRAALISVKSIKKLWRKSSKAANLSQAPAETPPAVPPAPSPTAAIPSVPQRPERAPQDQLYLPNTPDFPVQATMGRSSPNLAPQAQPHSQDQAYPVRQSLDQQNGPPQQSRLASPLPPSPHLPSQDQLFPSGRPSLDRQNIMPPPQPSNVGRLSPQLIPPPPSRPSLDQMPPTNRMSLEQYGRRPTPMQEQQQFMPPPRQSLDQFNPPQQYPPQQYPPQQYPPQQQFAPPPQHQYQQLNVPPYSGRNPNPGPIITPHMQASKSGSNLDRLHFDQESPYPTHRTAAPVRQSARPPSPTALDAIPEGENAGTRKSILRWKSAASTSSTSSSQSAPSSDHQTRTSLDRTSTNGSSYGRRPSVNNYASTRTSVTTPDLPLSPQIPNHLVKTGALDHRTSSQRSRLTTSSTDSSHSPPKRQISLNARSESPQRSMASSRDSQGSRPSFDASQFEFVSPKGASLSYPFNQLDQ